MIEGLKEHQINIYLSSVDAAEQQILLLFKVTNSNFHEIRNVCLNKANLRDLIAATSLVILIKIGSKLSIFLPM